MRSRESVVDERWPMTVGDRVDQAAMDTDATAVPGVAERGEQAASAGAQWGTRLLRRRGSGTLLVGLLLFGFVLAASLAAPLLTPYDPSRNNIVARLRGPVWDSAHRGSTD